MHPRNGGAPKKSIPALLDSLYLPLNAMHLNVNVTSKILKTFIFESWLYVSKRVSTWMMQIA